MKKHSTYKVLDAIAYAPLHCLKKYFRNEEVMQTWLENQGENTVFKCK